MRNLEFKTRVADLQLLLKRARELGADLWGDLRQTDTYFAVPLGRLKLRETAGFQAELIYYRRDETLPERPSDYLVARTPDAASVKSLLAAALGVLAVVRKRRTLLVLDSVRVHLDNVEGVGTFMEIEVPVRDGEAGAAMKLHSLLAGMGFVLDDGIRASYLDLVLEGAAGSETDARPS